MLSPAAPAPAVRAGHLRRSAHFHRTADGETHYVRTWECSPKNRVQKPKDGAKRARLAHLGGGANVDLNVEVLQEGKQVGRRRSVTGRGEPSGPGYGDRHYDGDFRQSNPCDCPHILSDISDRSSDVGCLGIDKGLRTSGRAESLARLANLSR